MTDLERALIRLSEDLRRIGVRWALIGGMAVSLHGEPRTTQDVDVTLALETDAEVDGVVQALFHSGYRQHPEGFLNRRGEDRLACIRLLAPGVSKPTLVDLMVAFTGIEREVVAAARPMVLVPGVVVPVARLGHLIALKLLAVEDRPGRKQDLPDLQTLLVRADAAELNLARESVELIVRRGFEPEECDLEAALGRWEREFR